MLEILAVFERKKETLEHTRCVIEKMVELSKQDYLQFSDNLLDAQDFIVENKDCMYEEKNGRNHCLLVLGEGMDDGILVQAEGCSYARFAASLPNARMLWNMEQHPALKTLYENAMQVYEHYTKQALSNHQNGHYRMYLPDVFSEPNSQYLTNSLLEDLMQENPAFEHAELIDDEIFITIPKQSQELQPENADVGISM